MKMDVIDMIQDISNDLDLDPVNSMDDTPESMQIAQILKTTYMAMMSNRNWPHLRRTIKLIPPQDDDHPTHMAVPANVKEMVLINYNTKKKGETKNRFTEVRWIDPDSFLRKANSHNTDNTNVVLVKDPTGIDIAILNNKAPEFYTSFDDTNIVFDSYDSVAEDTLRSSKIQALAYIMPEWEMRDDFIPDLPAEAFSALLEEAKSKASYKLKQQSDQKAEQEAARQQRWLSRKAWQVKGGVRYPSYGRGRVRYNEDFDLIQSRR